MKMNKINMKNGRGVLFSLLALFLLSVTFFPAIEALASPGGGFDVLSAEWIESDTEFYMNVTLERTKPTAMNIVGTLQLPEDYTYENFVLVDSEQSWGTMAKNEIKSVIYEIETSGDLVYPMEFSLDLVYTFNGRQKSDTLTLDELIWLGHGNVQPEHTAMLPHNEKFTASNTNKGSGSTFKTWVHYHAFRIDHDYYDWKKVRFQFTSSDYSDYTFWTVEYNFTIRIYRTTTALKTLTVGPFIDSNDAGGAVDYALNIGDYDIEGVYTWGDNPHTWSDTDDPDNLGGSNPVFSVSGDENDHKVFTLVLRDQEFLGEYDDYDNADEFITYIIAHRKMFLGILVEF